MSMQATRSLGSRVRSERLLERAKQSVAGGDSSTMRVLPYHPALMIDRGDGCRVWDVDNNEYIDLNMAYGPLLFGHRPPFLMESVIHQLEEKGSQLGFPQELNFLAAEKIKQLYPSIDLVRFANSGTEAVAAAVRLARAFTGRPNLLLFEGHYHGWSDTVFHKYHASREPGDSALRSPIPGSEGMNGAPRDVFLLPWNDAEALAAALKQLDGTVAAVLMEPVMGNAGVIPPRRGYLAAAHELTREHGALLIFDEVITGMRVAAGGAQGLYGVKPDITILSKALGSGFPVAAFGGSARIMEPIASGRLFHGGVYAGNALVLSAVNAVLSKIVADQDTLYPALRERAGQFASGVREILKRRRVNHVVQNVGPMVTVVLTKGEVEGFGNFAEIERDADFDGYIRLQHTLLDHGIYVHPNQYEPIYLSAAHRKEDIDEVLSRFDDAIQFWRC